MPPRARTPAAKKTEPQVSVVDQLADDAETVGKPTEYPPGAPEFKVLLAIRPRSRRGDFKRLLAELAEKSNIARDEQAKLKETTDPRQHEQILYRFSASLDDTLEVIEKALRMVAVDTEKFDAWAADVSDEDLQVTWAVYQQRTQPGEA